jgi:uncharacterized membrane protein YgcG
MAVAKASGFDWLGNGLPLSFNIIAYGCNIFIIKPFMAFFCVVTITRVKLPDKLNHANWYDKNAFHPVGKYGGSTGGGGSGGSWAK